LARVLLNAPQSQLLTWMGYTVAAPVGVFAISWPIAWAMNAQHPFLLTFGTSDIVPLAALILFGTSADVEHDAIFANQRSATLFVCKLISNLGGIFALAVYGALKANAIVLLAQPDNAIAQGRLQGFSGFSIVFLIASLALAIYTKSLLMVDQVTALAQAEGR
jgi:hypothetical protein